MMAPSWNRTITGVIACAALALPAHGAETYQVLAVPDAEHVVLHYRGLPVSLSLAHLDVPTDEAARGALQQRLTRMITGKKVEVLHTAGFGTDANGAARVQLVLDRTNVNEDLVAGGFARYQPGTKPEPVFENRIKAAQDKAKQNKAGVWGAGAAASAPAAAATPA
ncbi:MAG: thermonuclease family protein, partial [Planctomycetes bacterium]|nr:thermonuclease family protein [Planctomycetota bacterium]